MASSLTSLSHSMFTVGFVRGGRLKPKKKNQKKATKEKKAVFLRRCFEAAPPLRHCFEAAPPLRRSFEATPPLRRRYSNCLHISDHQIHNELTRCLASDQFHLLIYLEAEAALLGCLSKHQHSLKDVEYISADESHDTLKIPPTQTAIATATITHNCHKFTCVKKNKGTRKEEGCSKDA